MILKGSQRGGGKQLAVHLLNVHDNEHVHVHDLRGFTSDDLEGAFQEAYAVSRGTRCKQFLFSLSLNPPQNQNVRAETFEAAIAAVEKKMGLENQPRAIVFHEKDGRRHAHAVWSRIDAEQMKAINLPFYKMKLRDVSRELYLEHKWQMPRGLVNSRERDPGNFTLKEWQQAKRAGIDPKALKEMFRECWAASDSGKSFAAALKLRGYTLARGDRRSHVAVDYKGEVYAIARQTGQKTKDVRTRLGSADELPSIEQAKSAHAARMTDMLRRHIKDSEDRRTREVEKLAAQRKEIVERQRRQREELTKAHETRRATETRERTRRFSRGFGGLWDRLTGKHTKIKEQNKREAELSTQRDKAEKDKLTFRQLEERQFIHRRLREQRQQHREQVAELHRDIANFDRLKTREPQKLTEQFRQASRERKRTRTRDYDRDRGPEFER